MIGNWIKGKLKWDWKIGIGGASRETGLPSYSMNVFFGELMVWVLKKPRAGLVLNKSADSVLKPKQRDVVGHPSGLGQVMRDDHDRILMTELQDKVFNDSTR